MNNLIKKTAAIVFTVLVLFFAVISILAIWEVISITDVLSKSFKTLLVIFISSAVTLFIFSMLFRHDEEGKINKPPAS